MVAIPSSRRGNTRTVRKTPEWLKFALQALAWLVALPLAASVVVGLVCQGPRGAWRELQDVPRLMGGIYGGFAFTAVAIGAISLVVLLLWRFLRRPLRWLGQALLDLLTALFRRWRI